MLTGETRVMLSLVILFTYIVQVGRARPQHVFVPVPLSRHTCLPRGFTASLSSSSPSWSPKCPQVGNSVKQYYTFLIITLNVPSYWRKILVYGIISCVSSSLLLFRIFHEALLSIFNFVSNKRDFDEAIILTFSHLQCIFLRRIPVTDLAKICAKIKLW